MGRHPLAAAGHPRPAGHRAERALHGVVPGPGHLHRGRHRLGAVDDHGDPGAAHRVMLSAPAGSHPWLPGVEAFASRRRPSIWGNSRAGVTRDCYSRVTWDPPLNYRAVDETERLMGDAQKPFGDKLVVVTGAGSGIGRATALGFAANGARVVAADLNQAAATSVSEVIAGRGGAAHARQVDVAAAADMERFANWVRTEVGVPDVVVNNAGIAVVGPLLATTEEDWQRIVGVILLGVARGCRLFGAQMAERGTGGHLVNIASAAAYAPSASLPAYAATKA